MACEHEWLGTAEGVTCSKCGKQLSAKEYRALLKPKAAKKPAAKKKGE